MLERGPWGGVPRDGRDIIAASIAFGILWSAFRKGLGTLLNVSRTRHIGDERRKVMTVSRLQIDVLPASWEQGPEPGWFRATAVPAKGATWSRVRAFEPLDRNPDYLLDRVGARVDGPLGRPAVASLPESLADGIAVVASELASDDSLTARVELVRRAWDLDIVLSARTSEIEATEALVSAMVELLGAVVPSGEVA
jgi:hypothetical protein